MPSRTGHRRRAASFVWAAMLSLSLLVAAPAFAAEPPGQYTRTEIHVSGEASVSVNPDTATVVLAVESQAETAPEAQAENARRTQEILAALVEAGVDKDAVTTANFRLNPVWSSSSPRTGNDRNDDVPVIVAYRVSHDMRIRASDIDRLGAIVDAAVDAGAHRVSHIEFSVKDAHQYRNRLLQEAILDARSKAEALAEAAGLTLLGPSQINESGMSVPLRPTMRMAADAAFAATEIMPDEQRLSVHVSVTYVAELP